MTTRLQVRDSDPFYTAAPEPVGSDNSAPAPMEYVRAAMSGCPAGVMETAAGELERIIDATKIGSRANTDTRALLGTAVVSPHFSHINRIRFTSYEVKAQPEHPIEHAAARCPAANLIRDAGVPVVLARSVARRAESSMKTRGGS